MAIYQPTNVTPSTLGAPGNGVVDITEDLVVSWQVNGNTPMTSFSIKIYKNDPTSTLVYDTGQRQEGCPFAGKDALGNFVFFDYTISASDTAAAGMTNGQSYKLVITQWWGDSEYVQQTSASAFITRAKPTLTIAEIPSPLQARLYTFKANYQQAQGDALNWVRWQIAQQGQVETPLMDTGNIYATPVLEFNYDGLFTQTDYAVRCRIQTENGIEADTGWVTFQVQYENGPLEGLVTAQGACERSGVRVGWPSITYIPGTSAQEPTWARPVPTPAQPQQSYCLSGGFPVTWNSVNDADMQFSSPWSGGFVLRGNRYNAWPGWCKLTIRGSGHTAILEYYNHDIVENGETTGIASLQIAVDGAILATAVDQRADVPTNSRGNALYCILAPQRILIIGTGRTISAEISDPEAMNFPIESIEVDKVVTNPRVQRVKILSDGLVGQSEEEIKEAFSSKWTEDTLLLTRFQDRTLSAGNVDLGDGTSGLSIYRYEDGAPSLKHVEEAPLWQNQIIDCDVVNGKTYTWYVFGTDGNKFSTSAIVSPPYTPCSWDWTILSCTTQDNVNFTPQAIYRFGYNISSGSVGNNNNPGIFQNFTRYPVCQPAPANYASGTLSGLIGSVSYENGPEYRDTVALRDEIYALSATNNTLFLKDRKGSLRKIRVGGPITMTTMDESTMQAQTMALPWVEVGSAEGISIILTESDALWTYPAEKGE